MMKKFSIILAAAIMTACGVQKPVASELLSPEAERLSSVVVRSEMQRCPDATYLDGMEGTLKWNYTTGLELKAFLDVYEISRLATLARNDNDLSSRPEQSGVERSVFDYVKAWYDAAINENGEIYNYKKSNFSTDHICPGRTLFQLYDLTGDPRYRKAMDVLYDQLLEQPRTPEGGFWHKQVYPNQMWLDGLYMAQPFYAEYTARYVTDPAQRQRSFDDIVHQFETVYHYTYDVETGLLRHAWDASHEMFWCDPATGRSAHAWGRALGWYCMALVDVIEILPEGEGRASLAALLQDLYDVLPRYADPETGMWYQVLDQPGREGNYVEATASAMFVYAWLKGIRLGVLDGQDGLDEARAAYDALLRTFVTEEDGLVTLHRCCEVAGLGGKQNRSGDYDYYINERVRDNDPKGIGPLIWAALEYERL